MDSGFSGNMIFLVFLVLLLFGPRKLPEIVRIVRHFLREIRHVRGELWGVGREIGQLEPSRPANTLSSLAENLEKP